MSEAVRLPCNRDDLVDAACRKEEKPVRGLKKRGHEAQNALSLWRHPMLLEDLGERSGKSLPKEQLSHFSGSLQQANWARVFAKVEELGDMPNIGTSHRRSQVEIRMRGRNMKKGKRPRKRTLCETLVGYRGKQRKEKGPLAGRTSS